jgi:hypothetical protein
MAEVTKLSVRRGQETHGTPATRVLPTRIARPDTPRKALQEASRLYRDARLGYLPTDEASRLAFMLKTTSDLVERAVIEPRLDALEARLLAISEMLARRQG